MKPTTITLSVLLFPAFALFAEEPMYSLESTAGIIQELSKDKYEQPVKTWLEESRPQQYEQLFGEKTEEAERESDDQRPGLFGALAEISAAIAKPQIALLDYYINQKASEGWHVASMSETVILFRKQPRNTEEPTAR